jgi:hypothetical protein
MVRPNYAAERRATDRAKRAQVAERLRRREERRARKVSAPTPATAATAPTMAELVAAGTRDLALAANPFAKATRPERNNDDDELPTGPVMPPSRAYRDEDGAEI